MIAEIEGNITINSIIEEGKLNKYLSIKYFKDIKSNEIFDKIAIECLLKGGYKLIRIGTGNYITNPSKYK